MWSKHSFIASLVLGLLLLGQLPLAWAAGTQIVAITEALGNWVVTIQWIVGVVGTLLLMVSCFIAIRGEAVGLIGILFAVICIIIAIKAPDIIASFGPQRAIAATVAPIVIRAGQQVLDAFVTLVVHGVWGLIVVWQVRHGRRALGL